MDLLHHDPVRRRISGRPGLNMLCPNCQKELPDGFQFCGHCGKDLRESLRAERRDVTIIFADMKGFTSMSEKMEPEDVQEVMNECFEGLGLAVQEEDGQVNKYSGDCVMAQWGAPVAHEDDPARACRAALAMQRFLEEYANRSEEDRGVRLKLRIGIHCGLVAAGGIGHEDVRKIYDVMGDTVNLAQRLESAAEPGSILVSSEVAKRTAGAFELGPVQELRVKGKAEPVQAFTLLRMIAEEPRRGRDGLSVEMVGRENEVRQLLKWWEAPAAEVTHVELRGPMGIGKTRLMEEAFPRMQDRTLVSVAASPLVCRRSFGLARRLLQSALSELGHRDDMPESREAFGALVEPLGEDLKFFVDALWFLAAPTRAEVDVPDPDPQTLRSLVERGVATFLQELGRQRAGLTLHFDSYEMADAESHSLFDLLGDEEDRRYYRFIFAVRPSAAEPPDAPSVVDIPPLPLDDAARLLEKLVRGAVLPEALRDDLLRRADGIPLYLEELVRSLLDSGALQRQDRERWRYTAAEDQPHPDLPPSLRAAMVARLDRLGWEARDFLCECAVQGLEFSLVVAGNVWAQTHPTAASADDIRKHIEDDGLIRRGENMDSDQMVFMNPLLREACYDMLTRKNRKAVHALVVDALVDQAGGEEGVAPEVLSYHYEAAGHWSAAAAAELRRAHRAASLFLNGAALSHIERVLEDVERVTSPTPDDRRNAAAACDLRAEIQLRIGVYAEARESARELRRRAAGPRDRASALHLEAMAVLHAGDADTARALLRRAIDSAWEYEEAKEMMPLLYMDLAEILHRENDGQEALRLIHELRQTHPALAPLTAIRLDMLEGKLLHTKGRFADAGRFYRMAADAADRSGTLSERARARNSLGNVARDEGRYEEATAYFQQALQFWQKIGDVVGIAGAQNNLGNLSMSLGDFEAARTHQEAALAAFTDIGNAQGAAMAQANLAVLALESGDADEAVQLAERALELLPPSGQWLRALVLGVRGDALLARGDADEAASVFAAIESEFAVTTHPLAIAGALRGLGRVELLRNRPEQAMRRLGEATTLYVRLKRSQEAARTQVFQAESHVMTGQREAARTCLEAALERFQQMHAQRDVERVRELLRRLRAEGDQ